MRCLRRARGIRRSRVELHPNLRNVGNAAAVNNSETCTVSVWTNRGYGLPRTWPPCTSIGSWLWPVITNYCAPFSPPGAVSPQQWHLMLKKCRGLQTVTVGRRTITTTPSSSVPYGCMYNTNFHSVLFRLPEKQRLPVPWIMSWDKHHFSLPPLRWCGLDDVRRASGVKGLL